MIGWLTRRRKMPGGLYFGPPGWSPEQLSDARLDSDPHPSEPAPRSIPQDRETLTQLLESIALTRTSAITPGLLEQVQDLGKRDITSIVLNLLPTQPEFALASGLTRLAIREILDGLAAIQHAIKPRRILVLLDRHDWRTQRIWRRARTAQSKSNKKQPPEKRWNFDIKSILNQYPIAHPTLLIRLLFGKRLPVGRLPVRVNRIVVDPVTCWALGRWIRTGRPLIDRPIQLFFGGGRGEKDGSARLVMGTVGETIESLCTRHGLATAQLQVIVNGMLAGEEVDPAHAKVESCTESVSVREYPLAEHPTPCFSCGWCVDVCPTALNPLSLFNLAEEAQRGGGAETQVGAAELRSGAARESLHCIGCGLCSYVCPTRLPLTQRTLRLRGWVVGAASIEPPVHHEHHPVPIPPDNNPSPPGDAP